MAGSRRVLHVTSRSRASAYPAPAAWRCLTVPASERASSRERDRSTALGALPPREVSPNVPKMCGRLRPARSEGAGRGRYISAARGLGGGRAWSRTERRLGEPTSEAVPHGAVTAAPILPPDFPPRGPAGGTVSPDFPHARRTRLGTPGHGEEEGGAATVQVKRGFRGKPAGRDWRARRESNPQPSDP